LSPWTAKNGIKKHQYQNDPLNNTKTLFFVKFRVIQWIVFTNCMSENLF